MPKQINCVRIGSGIYKQHMFHFLSGGLCSPPNVVHFFKNYLAKSHPKSEQEELVNYMSIRPSNIEPSNPPTPSSASARQQMKRAEQLAKKGQFAEAIETLEQAMEKGADRYSCYLRQAKFYQEGRKIQEALKATEKAIAEAPEKLSAREALIAFHLAAKNYHLAVQASKALLKISPRHIPARDALGAAYIATGNFEGAMRVATELIRLDPNNPSHRFNRAYLYQSIGEVQMAIEEFEIVVNMANDDRLIANSLTQIESLDTLQIRQIIGLAFEDTIFRLELLRNPAYAINSKCFYLSENGLQALQDCVIDHLADMTPLSRPAVYN